MDAFPSEHLGREEFDEAYPKLGSVELGSDELDDVLGKYERIYEDKSVFDVLKENAEKTLSNLPERDALYINQSDKESELYESDEVKKLSAEEKIVFKEFFNAFREENNLVDSADSAHEKLLEECLAKKKILIDESIKISGRTRYVDDDRQTEELEKQFIEKIWRLEDRNKLQISLELYCLSKFVYFKINEEGSSELDLEKIGIAHQLANLVAKALWVDLKR
jgi:hypothetical protein